MKHKRKNMKILFNSNRIIKITALISLALILCCGNIMAQTTLFTSPCDKETYKVPHRIPAIVKTGKKLIAFVDKRYSQGDVGQTKDGTYGYRIDTKMRKSYDNGKTWTEDITIAEGFAGTIRKNIWGKTYLDDDGYGFGDIAVVADRENPQNIVYFCVGGNKQFGSSEKGSTNKIYRFRSNDGGENWTNPADDITDSIFNVTLDENFHGAFFSSGSILQSSKVKVGSHYRLYAAIHTNIKVKEGLFGSKVTNNKSTTVVYSDDFGYTWKRLGTEGTNVTIATKKEGNTVIEEGNEAKCQELPNGDIVVSCRAANGRIFNIFHYNDYSKITSDNPADGSWKTQAKATFCNDSGTNGEFLIIKAVGKDGEGLYALQSMPAGPDGEPYPDPENTDRCNLAIFYKKIGDINGNAIDDNFTNPATFASGWKEAIRVSNTTSAYSTMTQLNDGSLAFLYEDDEKSTSEDNWVPAGNAYDIKYQNLKISDIIPGGTAVYMNKKMTTTTDEKVGYSWATFYHDYPMTMPEGVTAYVATTHNDTHVFIKPIDGNVIPANTAVLLVDPQKKENIMLQYGGDTKNVTVPTPNLLTGTVEKKIDIDMTTTDPDHESYYKKYYVIGYGKKGVGFYRTNVGIPAGLAYCDASKLDKLAAAKSSFGFIFSEGAATGIEEIKTNTRPANNTYYNLSGQAVKNPTKGIYILNGKKVIIK